MKELYLGLAITAFIVLALTISVEVSASGSYLNKTLNRNNVSKNKTKVNPTSMASPVSANSLDNTLPDRTYNKNNLNKLFLNKYYKKMLIPNIIQKIIFISQINLFYLLYE